MRTTEDRWIQTYNGIAADPVELDPADVSLDDIAHSLSNLCRFNGHTREFYSVAEHSVRVFRYVESMIDSPWAREYWPKERVAPDVLKWALMHDAAEAYLGDVPSPLKKHMRIEAIVRNFGWVPVEFSDIERITLTTIAKRFGMTPPSHPDNPLRFISPHDYHLLAAEARDLLEGGPLHGWIGTSVAESIEVIEPWTPQVAKVKFLAVAHRIGLKAIDQPHCKEPTT